MKRTVRNFVFLLFLCGTWSACEAEYSRTVKKELDSGVIHEDLIFGMKMGQTQKDFYDICWNLNKQKLVSQGPGNRFARHYMAMDSTVQDPEMVDMLFYGIFDQQKVMHGMHMKMTYTKWSPWNDRYQPDSLLYDLQEKYMREYGGNPFLEINIKEDLKALAKVDGNRQIIMYPSSNKEVTVKIEDLRFKTSGAEELK